MDGFYLSSSCSMPPHYESDSIRCHNRVLLETEKELFPTYVTVYKYKNRWEGGSMIES